jgi:catechol 2,3-dioxygenase-like lactoylglutathione lyase family enzyme
MKFRKMSPLLHVSDIDRSIEFYTNNLGFTLDFKYEDFYAGIIKDGHSIHLKSVDQPITTVRNTDDLEIQFSVVDIEQLYSELRGKPVNMIQPLRTQPYGKEFYITDPDGNPLGFVEETQ